MAGVDAAEKVADLVPLAVAAGIATKTMEYVGKSSKPKRKKTRKTIKKSATRKSTTRKKPTKKKRGGFTRDELLNMGLP